MGLQEPISNDTRPGGASQKLALSALPDPGNLEGSKFNTVQDSSPQAKTLDRAQSMLQFADAISGVRDYFSRVTGVDMTYLQIRMLDDPAGESFAHITTTAASRSEESYLPKTPAITFNYALTERFPDPNSILHWIVPHELGHEIDQTLGNTTLDRLGADRVSKNSPQHSADFINGNREDLYSLAAENIKGWKETRVESSVVSDRIRNFLAVETDFEESVVDGLAANLQLKYGPGDYATRLQNGAQGFLGAPFDSAQTPTGSLRFAVVAEFLAKRLEQSFGEPQPETILALKDRAALYMDKFKEGFSYLDNSAQQKLETMMAKAFSWGFEVSLDAKAS